MEIKKIWCTNCNANVEAIDGPRTLKTETLHCWNCPTCNGFSPQYNNKEPIGAIGNTYFQMVRSVLQMYIQETVNHTDTDEMTLNVRLSQRIGYKFDIAALYSVNETLIVINLLHQIVSELTQTHEHKRNRQLFKDGFYSNPPHMDEYSKTVKRQLHIERLAAISRKEIKPYTVIQTYLVEIQNAVDKIWIKGYAPRKDFYTRIADKLKKDFGELTFQTEEQAYKALITTEKFTRKVMSDRFESQAW